MKLKFYTSVTKRLKLKVKKFWNLAPTFVAVTGEKLVVGGGVGEGGGFAPTPFAISSLIGLIRVFNLLCWVGTVHYIAAPR